METNGPRLRCNGDSPSVHFYRKPVIKKSLLRINTKGIQLFSRRSPLRKKKERLYPFKSLTLTIDTSNEVFIYLSS